MTGPSDSTVSLMDGASAAAKRMLLKLSLSPPLKGDLGLIEVKVSFNLAKFLTETTAEIKQG